MKRIALSLVMALVCMTSVAQIWDENDVQRGYSSYPYGFVQLQGGVASSFTDVGFFKLVTPTASVAAGAFFTPVVGARLHFNGWESKGGFSQLEDKYKFNYLTSNVDLLFNLTNLFDRRNTHLFNVILVGGAGLSCAWGNDEFRSILLEKSPIDDLAAAWGGSGKSSMLSHNMRLGVLLNFNLSKHWDVGLEVDFNSLSDKFNSKHSGADDWTASAQIGVAYKFGYGKPKVPKVSADTNLQDFVDNNSAEVAHVNPAKTEEKPDVKKPDPAPQPESVKVEVHFTINKHDQMSKADMKRIDDLVVWLKDHSQAKVMVVGYADKGTGNARINARLAKQRAEYVTSLLTKGGIAADRIVTDSKGDTVQPFTENDLNRAVICTSEGLKDK